ncbi:MAG: hypothetical protein JKP90_23205 [Desulfofustis sp. PB-SRB1]|nr:hypothetical protein [Desulfofustis sp. PB-SRB1]
MQREKHRTISEPKHLPKEKKNGTFLIEITKKQREEGATKQQIILPCIPMGATEINSRVGVWRDDQQWTYFLGGHPVYSHRADDRRMFRLVTAQLIESGGCRQVDIIRTFGVPKRNVIRAVNKLRQEGVEGFFKPRPARQGGTVLTPPVLAKAQSLLDEHHSRSEVAKELGVKYDTLRKAINDGRLKEPTHLQFQPNHPVIR